MSRRRTAMGWLMTVLGGLGVVVSLALILGVWMLSSRLTGTVTETASVVTDFTQLAHERAGLVEVRLAESKEKLEDLQKRMDASAEAASIDPDAVRKAAAELRAHLAEYDEWVALAGSSREFMNLLNELLGSVAVVAGADDGFQASSAMVDGVDQVRDAKDLLKQLRQGLDEAMEGIDPMELKASAEPKLLQWVEALSALEIKVEEFRKDVIRVEAAVEALAGKLLFRIRLVVWILSFLLIWQAAAQASLAVRGRHLVTGQKG